MALTDDELSALNPSQRSAYADAVRRCQDDHQLVREVSYGQPWSKTYSDNWKSDFGGALGFLFFLGSFILFPAALGIVAALGLGADDNMAPAIAVYVGLLLGIAALKATVTAERPPPRPPINKLRTERMAAIDSHWREVAERQRKPEAARERDGSEQTPLDAPSPLRSPSSTSTSSRLSARSSKAGAHPVAGAGGGSITSGNRSLPGAEYTPWISAEEKLAIAGFFNWVCQLCLKPIDSTIRHDYENPNPDRLVIDHVTPRKHGGTDDRSNLQPAHHRCNSRKGDRLITNEEYRRRYLGGEPGSASRQSSIGLRTPSAPSQVARSAHRRNESADSVRNPRPSGPRAQHAPIGFWERQSRAQRERSDVFWAKPHEGLLTHCEQGHEFTEENTYYRLRPDRTWGIERECRVCRKQ